MTRHLVAYQPRDVLQRSINDAVHEVSFDDGKTWRVLRGQEQTDGFDVNVGQTFVARISKPGTWPLVQKLVVKANDPRAPQLEPIRPFDFAASSFFSHTMSGSGWRHVLFASLTLFRDASQDRAARGLGPIPQYMHDILTFDGESVLSSVQGNTGLRRFAAHVSRNVPSYGPNGSLLFAKAPDNTIVPRLIAVFIPNGMDLTQPIPMHIFFTPSTGRKNGEYPYTGDWNAMIDAYLVGGGKRLLNQHAASRKKCVFVFPVAPPAQYFSGIQESARLRQYLIETAYWLMRTVGQNRVPEPRLGRCAVSGFSYAGNVLLQVLNTSQGNEFPELRECYALDIVADGGASAFATAVSSWWGGGNKGRRVRLYSEYPDWSIVGRQFSASATRVSVGGAEEYQARDATCALTPLDFWQTVYREEGGSLLGYFTGVPQGSSLGANSLHQAMPGIFLEHALKNSGFPDI